MKEAIIYNHHHIYSKRERETDSGSERERERNIVSECVYVRGYTEKMYNKRMHIV